MPASSGKTSSTNDALAIIKHYEGCKLAAYQDSKGVWTIGYGHTLGVKRGDTCTQAQADAWLASDVGAAALAVDRAVPVLPACERAALTSFTFNLGAGALNASTLLKKLLAGDTLGAADEFLRWHYAGPTSLLGLRRRRAAERALFLGASAANAIKAGDAAT